MSTSIVASEPAFETGKNQVPTSGDVAEKADLTGHAHLRKNRRCARDGLRTLEAIEALGNLQVAIRLGLQICPDNQLSVVEIKHARRKEQDERADEQAEIQMQVSKPSIEQRASSATDVCVRGRPASWPLRHPSAQSSSPTQAPSCRARQSSGASTRRQMSGALSTAARPVADCAR